ncbi:MAG TPA: hypothetical protein PKC12_04620 [Thiobacillaceae bacterium]|nr:hypothetical protein [Thiobacillaceae bacterium]
MKPPLKKRVPKPRNPYVSPARFRKAGEHGKSRGARRQAEKQALRERLAEP